MILYMEVMGSAVPDCSIMLMLLDGAARQMNDVKGEMCEAEETSQRLLLTFINPQNRPVPSPPPGEPTILSSTWLKMATLG